MSKKNPSPPEESGDLFGTQPRKKMVRMGKPRAKHEGLQACMDNFRKESEAWINHFVDDWFRSGSPLERPVDARKCHDALDLYSDALETLRVMANCVTRGQTCLKKGQAFAKQVLAETQASKRPKAEQSSDVPEMGEEQCDVMDELKRL